MNKKSHLNTVFTPLIDELDRWQEANRCATFWWRDDDVVEPSVALEQLLSLSNQFQIPLALAAIPEGVQASLVDAIAGENHIAILQHGYSHNNYAPAREKKQELGAHRAFNVVKQELIYGYERLRVGFREQFVPVLVPPWNRIDEEIVLWLQSDVSPYTALSRFGLCQSAEMTRFKEVNVHIDILNFKPSAHFKGYEAVITQIVDHLQSRRIDNWRLEATGLMTHHLVHDNESWRFLQQFFYCIAQHQAAKWQSIRALVPK